MKKFLIVMILCATPLYAQENLNTQEKLKRLEKSVELLEQKLYKKSNAAAFDSNENSDELYNKIDLLEQNIASLTSTQETLQNNIKKLEENYNKKLKDIEFRLNELDKESQSAIPTDKKTLTEQEAYDNAYALLKEGKYSKASQAFMAFLDDYPKSKLAGNANYWLGETFYVDGKYEEAVGIFAKGMTTYKSNAKAPDNLLKLGLSFKNLKKNQEACTAFLGLKEQFPKADQSILNRAQSEAKQLKCK